MKRLLVLICFLWGSFAVAQEKYMLSVNVSGIEKPGHKLYYAVYDKASGFLEAEAAIRKGTQSVGATKAVLKFSLPKGSYAVVLFYDVNDNGKLDKTLFPPIPKEPYGFSNNPKIMGKPKFEKCALAHAKDQQIEVVLND